MVTKRFENPPLTINNSKNSHSSILQDKVSPPHATSLVHESLSNARRGQQQDKIAPTVAKKVESISKKMKEGASKRDEKSTGKSKKPKTGKNDSKEKSKSNRKKQEKSTDKGKAASKETPIDRSKEKSKESEKVKQAEKRNETDKDKPYHQHRKDKENKVEASKVDPSPVNAEQPPERFDIQIEIFAESLISSLSPFLNLMRFIFLFPFQVNDTWRGGHLMEHNPFSPFSIGFIIVGIVNVILAVLYIMNFIGMLLDAPPSQNVTLVTKSTRELYPSKAIRAHELYTLQRNIIPALVTVCILFLAAYSMVSVFFRKKFLCDYYIFWMRAVEQCRIDAARGVTQPLITRITAVFVFILLLLIAACIRSSDKNTDGRTNGWGVSPIITGTQSIICMILFRIFNHIGGGWAILFSENFPIYRALLAGSFLYSIVVAKAYVILYAWTCDLLRQSFSVWNSRLERVLHQDASEDTRAEKVASRTGYDHLFKDHVCLLDLIEGADSLFSGIIRWFYATETVNLCFQFFHAWRSQQAVDEFHGGRRFDGAVMMVFVVFTFYFLVTVSWSAAYVSEEAMNGLEIIRRKGLLGRREDDEMYFLLSLYTSFTGHFQTGLSMGGYADVNKGFLVALFGTALTYGIVLFQFTPSLTYKNQEYLIYLRQNLSIKEIDLIERTEFTADPFAYGQTFIKLGGFAPEWDPNGTDLWDFFHDPDFLAFHNMTKEDWPRPEHGGDLCMDELGDDRPMNTRITMSVSLPFFKMMMTMIIVAASIAFLMFAFP